MEDMNLLVGIVDAQLFKAVLLGRNLCNTVYEFTVVFFLVQVLQ
jgi:hypothetical protein